MRSLNTYNYHEELLLKPISYNVTISDEDKIIKVEEDGDLKAEIGFKVDGNILFVNGKDGMEIASVELPIALAEITRLSYNKDDKEIELRTLKTNGVETTFLMNVEELVNIYTAGDGIDITDNMISIKIKDTDGPLHADEDGLCIDMNTFATPDDVKKINDDIDTINRKTDVLTTHVNNSIQIINESIVTVNNNVKNGFDVINGGIDVIRTQLSEEVERSTEKDKEFDLSLTELNTKLSEEIKRSTEKDDDLQKQLGDIDVDTTGDVNTRLNNLDKKIGESQGSIEGSLTEAINGIKDQIGGIETDIDGIHDELGNIKDQIGNVESGLTGTITEEIDKIKDQIGDIQGGLEGSISTQISNVKNDLKVESEARKKQDESIINTIVETNKNLATAIDTINKNVADSINTINGGINTIKEDLSEETTNRISGDDYLQKQLGDGFKSAIPELYSATGLNVTQKFQQVETDFSEKIQTEKKERTTSDNDIILKLEKETADRITADNQIKELINSNSSSLIDSIQLVKDKENNLKYHLMINNVNHGSISIPEDKMLESVTYDEEKKELTFNWNVSANQSPTVINIKDLIDTYKSGDGLLLEGNVFKLNTTTSKYLKLNGNSCIDFVGEFKKNTEKDWTYELIDIDGANHGKIIDFTSDYDKFKKHIEGTYAPKTYVDEKDSEITSSIIGKDSDESDANTFYGLRKAIKKSEDVFNAKIQEEKKRAENAEVSLGQRIDELTTSSQESLKAEIDAIKGKIDKNEEAHSAKHTELSNSITANSDKINVISNIEKNGTLDVLDKQFKEVTRGIDINSFEGLLKSLVDRIKVLETTVDKLTKNDTENGSISNSIKVALEQAKLYTDNKVLTHDVEIKKWADVKYQLQGEYLTSIPAEYVTETELNKELGTYVTTLKLSEDLKAYETIESAKEKYAPKNNSYLTSIPAEYITENELSAKDYATKADLTLSTKDMLIRSTADTLYAKIDTDDKYVTTSVLSAKDYINNATFIEKLNTKANSTELEKFALKKHTHAIGDITSLHDELNKKATIESLNNYSLTSHTHTISNVLDLQTSLDSKSTQQYVNDTFQRKGDYAYKVDVTTSEGKLRDEISTKLVLKADKSYVDSTFQTKGEFVTRPELEGKKYVTETSLSQKGYATTTSVNDAIRPKMNITDADTKFATKVDLRNHESSAFTASNIKSVENGNVIVNQVSNGVTLDSKLSTNYKVDDTYHQTLPLAGENMDAAIAKLSTAIIKLKTELDKKQDK